MNITLSFWNYFNIGEALSRFTPPDLRGVIGTVGSTAITAAGIAYSTGRCRPRQPDALPSLYSLPVPPLPFSSNELDKIRSLTQKTNVIAISRVQNLETSEWEPVYLTFYKDPYGREHFQIFDFSDRSLGYADTIPLPLEDPDFKGPWEFCIPEEYIGYGNDPQRVGKVKIEEIYTQPESENHKGSGHLLLKAILERYQDQFDGRIVLEATRSSHVFYYKHGFRASDDAKNREIELALESGQKPNTSHLGSVLMYLSDEAQGAWRRRPPLERLSDISQT